MAKSPSKSGKSNRSRPGFIGRFLRSEKDVPVIAAVAAGLYPVLFYYNNNFTLVNTWEHLGYFMLMFLLVPILIFWTGNKIFSLSVLKKWKKYLLPFLNVFVFLFLLKVCLYAGLQKKITMGILLISCLVAFFLYKHLKKIIILQFLLAILALWSFIPTVISQMNYSVEWMKQPDDISRATFSKKPNVYIIQPDGYVNFSRIEMPPYNYDNSGFENFLIEHGFENYDEFRSNYMSTLTSNSSAFVMKHHYYNKGTNFGEFLNARNILVTANPVLDLFKRNGYKTHLLIEKPYLLLNRPEMGYDECNYSMDDVAFIGTGLGESKELLAPLKDYMALEPDTPKFYFMELFSPGHITNSQAASKGAAEEREIWIDKLEVANLKLKQLIDTIVQQDPEAMIIIMSDHGGFVGFEHTQEVYRKIVDEKLINSIFSSQLSIRWPTDEHSDYDRQLKSSVNVFRVVISYLSGDKSYLNQLQDDGSYAIINEGAPKGIYEYINDEGEIVFKKFVGK